MRFDSGTPSFETCHCLGTTQPWVRGKIERTLCRPTVVSTIKISDTPLDHYTKLPGFDIPCPQYVAVNAHPPPQTSRTGGEILGRSFFENPTVFP